MSFPDPSPQPPPNAFVSMPYVGGEMGGFWPPMQMNQEHPELYSQFEPEPPFKRSRNSENTPPNSAPFQNPKVNPPNLPGKGSNHIFYKTRMCMKFLEGNCRNGEHCTFAHGPEDLREPPPNWQDIIREKDRGPGNWNNDPKAMMHRVKICKKFYNGEECPYGERCNFLHERSPQFKNDLVRDQRESSAISIGTTGSTLGRTSDSDPFEMINHNASVDSDASRIKPVFWKTKMCSKWEITGHCPFGERCHFAHGQLDLQAPIRAEIEATTNFASIPVKPPLVPVVDPSAANAMPCVPVKEEEDDEGKKFLKWKPNKKICTIYGDWIDDLVPPHLLCGQEEAEF